MQKIKSIDFKQILLKIIFKLFSFIYYETYDVNQLIRLNDKSRDHGRFQKALFYSELMIEKYPNSWNGYVRASQDCISLRSFDKAKLIGQKALEILPKYLVLLCAINDVYRASEEYEKALFYSRLIISNYPSDWNGYVRASMELMLLGYSNKSQSKTYFLESKNIIQSGIDRIPDNLHILCMADDIFRLFGEYEKSINYSRSIIDLYSNTAEGYIRLSLNLISMKLFKEAEKIIKDGIAANSEDIRLKKIDSYISKFTRSDHTIDIKELDNFQLNYQDLISYSHLDEYFNILSSRRKKSIKNKVYHKKFIFVSGMARSGTTALGKLLNISREVEIYTELFDPFRIDGYVVNDFATEDLKRSIYKNEERDINLPLFNTKHSNSNYIGDKRPDFHFCLEATFDNIKNKLRTVFIVRDLYSIARSTYIRSEDKNDYTWSLEKGIEHTVLLYNATCRQILYLHRKRTDVFNSIIFIDYSQIFSNTDYAIKLFKTLNIKLDDMEMDNLDKFISKSSEMALKPEPLDALHYEIKTLFNLYIDKKTHLSFCRISGTRDIILS